MHCSTQKPGIRTYSSVGVKQGYSLSPLLFNVTLDYVMSKVSKKFAGIRWGLCGKLTDLNCADDICLLAHSTWARQITLERIEKETSKVGLKINVNKSKEMHITMKNKESLCIHSETIGRVTHFAYLGSIIDNTGGTEEHRCIIDNCLASLIVFTQLDKFLCVSFILQYTHLQVFKIVTRTKVHRTIMMWMYCRRRRVFFFGKYLWIFNVAIITNWLRCWIQRCTDTLFSTHEVIFCIKTGGIKQWSVYKTQRGAEMFNVLGTPRKTEFVFIRKNNRLML